MSSQLGSTPTRDHVVFGVPDLQSSMDDFSERLGVAPVLGGRHDSMGTHNAILPLRGGSYLELIAPDPMRTNPILGIPWGLDQLEEPRLIAWAVATDSITAAALRAQRAGFDPGTVVEVARDTPDGQRLNWRLTVPRASKTVATGLIPFLIDWGSTPHPSDLSEAVCSLEGFRAEYSDPKSIRGALRTLGVSFDVEPGSLARLSATVVGPKGSINLG